MPRRPRRPTAPVRSDRTRADGRVEPAAIPLRHPALIAAALVAAACLVASASYVLYDTDLWQHLAIGRAIWTLHGIPRTCLWSWPQYGEPQVVSSWLFRVILWPVWSAGGVMGLYLVRWITTLAVFALLWATARAMGARGLLALLVLVWCGLIYRIRTDLRPEILAAPLFALELWILERRRLGVGTGARIDPAWALVPVAWAWANTHVSYYVGLLVPGFYLLDAVLARRPGGRGLAIVALASVAVSFLHPVGWRALWQPFQYLLEWRHDPLFMATGEYRPLPWREHLRSGLPLLLLLWPAVLALRIRRRGLDAVELLLCAFVTLATLSAQRFAAMYAMAAAPFVARDLCEHAAGGRLPRALAGAWPRAALTAGLAVLIALPEWSRHDLPLGIRIDPDIQPAAACDFMARAGVRGRAYNELQLGGYMLYRFWPDRSRLPFINTQPEYTTPEDRRLVIAAYTDAGAWRQLDRRHRFDYVLLERSQSSGSRLPDILDQDTTWAMVFADDASELLVRRDGPLRPVAERFAYRVLPAGTDARMRLVPQCAADSALRARAMAELETAVASSPRNGSAHHLLGLMMLMDHRPAEARAQLEQALRIARFQSAHEILGRLALEEGRFGDAARELGRERALYGRSPQLDALFDRARAGIEAERRSRP